LPKVVAQWCQSQVEPTPPDTLPIAPLHHRLIRLMWRKCLLCIIIGFVCYRVLQMQNILDLYLVIQTRGTLLAMSFGVLRSLWSVFCFVRM